MKMKSSEPGKKTQDMYPDERLYDLGILEEMDDKEYIVEIISIFLNDTPGELKEISTAATARKMEIVSKTAHKLKNSAGALQAKSLVYLLTEIETSAKAGCSNEEFIQLIEMTQQEYNNLEQALQLYLRNTGA